MMNGSQDDFEMCQQSRINEEPQCVDDGLDRAKICPLGFVEDIDEDVICEFIRKSEPMPLSLSYRLAPNPVIDDKARQMNYLMFEQVDD